MKMFGMNSLTFDKTGFGSINLIQDKRGITKIGDRNEYYFLGFEWLQNQKDLGKKKGKAVAGALLFGTAGAIIGSTATKNRVKDASTGVIMLENIKTGEQKNVSVKCNHKQATQLATFITK